jgi:hypothetical protein
MLFTPVVNNEYPNLAGFETSCDFFDDTYCSPSNKAEIFYGATPTTPGDGYADGTVSDWLWRMRAVIPHETKHITSDAERLARDYNGAVPEESWLEEGTAQIAAELYGRAIYGSSKAPWKGNATYANTLYCDLRPEWPECLDHPLVMLDHFSWLYDFGQDTRRQSVLDDGSDDPTIYGSAWSFARWAADAYATNEGTFFRTLTQSTALRGVDNIEAATGTAWPQLLGRWSLALVSDDRYPTSGSSAFPSWNIPDIFSNMETDVMNRDGQVLYPGPWIIGQTLSPEAFTISDTIAAGAFSWYLTNASAGMSHTFGVREAVHTPLPANSTVGVAILRIN